MTSAMASDAAAARAETVRTWFQAVQMSTYSAHRLAPLGLAASTAAKASFRGYGGYHGGWHRHGWGGGHGWHGGGWHGHH
jgi:hypothetical protein